MALGLVIAEADAALLPAALVAASLLLVFLLALLASRRQSKAAADKAAAAQALAGGAASGGGRWSGYEDPLRWAALPRQGPYMANMERAEVVDSELCTLKVLPLHRPTHEPWREKTGQYPFAWHLEGRKRLWEIRLQLRFKEVPKTKLYFGITLGGYVPVSGLSRQVQRVLVRACRSIVGDLYHSPGDDPARTQGEVEPPTFVMPIWAFDQFIVSNPGDEPHLWGSLEGLGMRRTEGVGAYVKAIRSTIENFSTDKVYTFSFWGVSQFLDCMNWEICGGVIPGVRLNFNKLCGSAPIYVAMYEMPGVSEEDVDRRHLPSRKKYFFHVAMWSQLRPPAPRVLENLLETATSSEESEKDKRSLGYGAKMGLLACCTARGGKIGSKGEEVPQPPSERAIGG